MPPALAIVFCAGLSLGRQESEAERLRRLEEQVRKQQADLDQLKSKGQGDVTASFKDGLRFKSADLEMHVGGRFQEDFRTILDRPSGARTSADTFFTRAARVQLDGTFWTEFGFMLQGDFPSATTGSAPTLQAAWLEWKRLPEFSLLFGHFKAPQGQEEMCSLPFHEFAERSTLSRFVPFFEVGIEAQGKLWGGALTYQAAVTNGRGHLANAGRSRNDDNDAKEVLLRLLASPWVGDADSPLRGLRLGVYGSMTRVDDVSMATGFDIVSAELAVTFLDSTAGFLDGRRWRLGAELSWVWGPVGLRAEVLRREDEIAGGSVETDLPTRAWYVAASVIVTGEDKPLDGRIVPSHPFDLRAGHWGALEVAFRAAGATIGDEIEDVGTSLLGQSRRMTSYTLGLNWWLARNVRVTADTIHEDFHDDVDFGGGRTERALTGFLVRFQFDF